MTTKRKRTPKERVLARYPLAESYEWRGPAWTIYANDGMGTSLGDGKTPALAWADAARRLTRRKER